MGVAATVGLPMWDGDRLYELNDAIADWAANWGLTPSDDDLNDAVHAVARIFIPR